MPRENAGNGVLLGTLIGGAIGVVSALLLAPKSGAKLREDLSNKIQSISQKTKDIATTVGQHTKDLAGNIKDEASELVDHAKQSNQHVMDTFSSAKEDVKDDMRASP
ncbi:MAG: YtxH domain-containing protein [Bacillota bacterium]